MKKIKIPFLLPGLNEYIRAMNRNRYEGNRLKKQVQADISRFLKGTAPVKCPVKVVFIWYEPTRRRDKDNVAAGKKFILDALQLCGILPNDNNCWVVGFEDQFVYGQGEGVEVVLDEVRPAPSGNGGPES